MAPVPPDIEETLLKIHEIDPHSFQLVTGGDDPFRWARGERLDEARSLLKSKLAELLEQQRKKRQGL